MKVFLLIFLFSRLTNVVGQTVTFEKDSIVIDNKTCFIYNKTGNNFIIQTTGDKKLIEGNMTYLAPGKFSTRYTFLTIDKEFYNERINGNDLIFFLIQNKIIESCGLNEKKLLKLIKKYNQL